MCSDNIASDIFPFLFYFDFVCVCMCWWGGGLADVWSSMPVGSVKDSTWVHCGG